MILPIVDPRSHAQALKRIQELWDAPSGSDVERELDALATLVDAYEKRSFPILPPDPIAAILARSEQMAWTRRNLEPLIGTRARVSEVLARKRALTLPMIRRIHTAMSIPADILIADSTQRLKKASRKKPAPRRSNERRSA